MSAARLTVTIPAYGDSPHLREAVASVLDQDVDGWALAVLDDGPPDPALADWFAGLGERVAYVRNPERLGINRNFARCLEAASTDLVVVLGSDDRLLPGYVRTMTAAAGAHPDATWLHPRVRVVDSTGAPAAGLQDRIKARLAIRPPAVVGGEELAVSLLRGNWMYFPAVTFRTEAVRPYGFRPGWQIVLDLDLYMRLLVDGATAALVDTECFEYRRHDESLSSQQRHTGARFAEERRYFAEAASTFDRIGWRRAARAARVHLTSRLHAAALVPAALGAGDWPGVRNLSGHVALP